MQASTADSARTRRRSRVGTARTEWDNTRLPPRGIAWKRTSATISAAGLTALGPRLGVSPARFQVRANTPRQLRQDTRSEVSPSQCRATSDACKGRGRRNSAPTGSPRTLDDFRAISRRCARCRSVRGAADTAQYRAPHSARFRCPLSGGEVFELGLPGTCSPPVARRFRCPALGCSRCIVRVPWQRIRCNLAVQSAHSGH